MTTEQIEQREIRTMSDLLFAVQYLFLLLLSQPTSQPFITEANILDTLNRGGLKMTPELLTLVLGIAQDTLGLSHKWSARYSTENPDLSQTAWAFPNRGDRTFIDDGHLFSSSQ
jgi:hypothetical protein